MAKSKPFYMNPLVMALIVIVVIIAVIGLWIMGTYNNFITLNQNIESQWAQVETQYQRRIDLIPNLVNTAKGYMQFESDLLTEITELRSQWAATSGVDNRVNIGNALDSALGRLIAVFENYPTLQSSEPIANLMVQLEGTENRIAVERMRFNEVVRSYNTAVLTFPSNIIANMFGFEQKPYFESQEGAEIAPTVNLTIS